MIKLSCYFLDREVTLLRRCACTEIGAGAAGSALTKILENASSPVIADSKLPHFGAPLVLDLRQREMSKEVFFHFVLCLLLGRRYADFLALGGAEGAMKWEHSEDEEWGRSDEVNSLITKILDNVRVVYETD